MKKKHWKKTAARNAEYAAEYAKHLDDAETRITELEKSLAERADYWEVHRQLGEIRGRVGQVVINLQQLLSWSVVPEFQTAYGEALKQVGEILEDLPHYDGSKFRPRPHAAN